MPKYPNECKVTTKKSESCKANEINLLCNEGIPQLYLSSELIIHEVVHDCNVFHLYASSSLGYGVCPYAVMSAVRYTAGVPGRYMTCPFLVSG